MKILSERLFLLRTERNLKQEEVSKALGIGFQSYRRYEHDERDPSAPVIVAMANFFNVSSDYLLGLRDER
ncbi:MAG: helix-turn-helix transcriptional regulator [Oscillospiraceae bacterium]|nr:helix-turn-helix transcriptional regulator [Oscillospiraceae bacterium]